MTFALGDPVITFRTFNGWLSKIQKSNYGVTVTAIQQFLTFHLLNIVRTNFKAVIQLYRISIILVPIKIWTPLIWKRHTYYALLMTTLKNINDRKQNLWLTWLVDLLGLLNRLVWFSLPSVNHGWIGKGESSVQLKKDANSLERPIHFAWSYFRAWNMRKDLLKTILNRNLLLACHLSHWDWDDKVTEFLAGGFNK